MDVLYKPRDLVRHSSKFYCACKHDRIEAL